MATITTKYSIGDVVYRAGTTTTRKQQPCPDCKGSHQWKAVSPAGEEYTFVCPRCAASYRSFRDISLEYTAHVPCVTKLTIGSVRYDSGGRPSGAEYMCLETGIGSGTIHRETDLFETEEAAQQAAEMRAKLANTETKWVAKLFDKTLEISDYQLSAALLKVAKDEQSRARDMIWNISDLFSSIESAENMDAVHEAVAEYKLRDWTEDRQAAEAAWAASADTHPKGGDVKQAPAPLSGAVPKADAQLQSPTPHQDSQRREG